MRTLVAALAVIALGVTVPACGSGDEGGDGRVEGEITVLTNRTDLLDTAFEDYRRRFAEQYPDVEVTVEGVTDYEGEMKIRMTTKSYGDVLLIPNALATDQLPRYFEPLGPVSQLSAKYRFVTERAYRDEVYGLAITGNAFGFVYNKRVWADAGITAPPKTPAAFLDALRRIRDRTEAVPLYTNYRNGWPLAQWEDARSSVTADPQTSNLLAADDAPWAPGKPHHVVDSLLFDAVAGGLVEDDPAETDWEKSKTMIGTGEIATMMLGSWAISQLRAAAPDPAVIGYLPFPVQVGGAFHSVVAGDYKNAISVHSKNKRAARAWLDWFADSSGYAAAEGGVSPLLGGPIPATLDDFTAAGVKYFELDHAKDAEVTRIDSAAGIGLYDQTYRQALVDAARGASGKSKRDVFDDLNTRWAEARALVTR